MTSCILWVGLSAKKRKTVTLPPLCETTVSGRLVTEATERMPAFAHHRTNLVAFAPMDSKNRLRYPTDEEMRCGAGNLIKAINNLQPTIVVLLGAKTANAVFTGLKSNHRVTSFRDYEYSALTINGTAFVPVHHPSYIAVYKRKTKARYFAAISASINKTPRTFVRGGEQRLVVTC